MRFFERPNCHLCHDAWLVLESLGAVGGVERVDVDRDPVLAADYGLRIPVLVDAQGRVLAEGIFDAADLRRRLPG